MDAASDFDKNPAHAQPDWPAAVVCSAFLTGLWAARDLERRGVRVTMIDCDRSVHGFRSTYATTVECPNPDTDPDDWLGFMLDLARRLGGRPALLVASDQFVAAVGRYADELAKVYEVARSARVQAELSVKEGQARLAERHGLPVPRTGLAVSEEEALHVASSGLRFPLIMKPLQQRFWGAAGPGHPFHLAKAVEARDPDELRKQYRIAATLAPEVVLQELIPGADTEKRVYVGIYGRNGNKLGSLTLAELRCIHFGPPTVNEPIEDSEIARVCDSFFQAIGYQGVGEIELIWDRRDGIPKALDINPRFTGAGTAAYYGGLPQAWLVYLDLIGKPLLPVHQPLRLFRHTMMTTDVRAIREYWLAGKFRWADIVRTYRPPVYFWDLDWRDRRLSREVLYASFRVAAGTVLAMLGLRGAARRD